MILILCIEFYGRGRYVYDVVSIDSLIVSLREVAIGNRDVKIDMISYREVETVTITAWHFSLY